jgi:hypothetical protein
MPLRMVARLPVQTLDTFANRRVIWLTQELHRIASDVADTAPPAERERCSAWARRAEVVLNHSALRELRPMARRPPPRARTVEEVIDVRYRTTFGTALRLSDLTSWSASRERRDGYSYIRYSDEIYQTFVAYAVAAALGLDPTAEVLGMQQPAFTSSDWHLYYNCTPPENVMRSWRSFAARPDSPRPDLLLVSRDQRVVLVDAKYRSDGDRASESSYQEVMAYMAAFALDQAVIAFPPSDGATLKVIRVEARGQAVIELPIAPVDGLEVFLRREIPSLVAATKAIPAWRS